MCVSTSSLPNELLLLTQLQLGLQQILFVDILTNITQELKAGSGSKIRVPLILLPIMMMIHHF